MYKRILMILAKIRCCLHALAWKSRPWQKRDDVSWYCQDKGAGLLLRFLAMFGLMEFGHDGKLVFCLEHGIDESGQAVTEASLEQITA